MKAAGEGYEIKNPSKFAVFEDHLIYADDTAFPDEIETGLLRGDKLHVEIADKVSAEPEHIDEGLVRFKYSFEDGSDYKLNLYPLRKTYMRKLLHEAGFERVRWLPLPPDPQAKGPVLFTAAALRPDGPDGSRMNGTTTGNGEVE